MKKIRTITGLILCLATVLSFAGCFDVEIKVVGNVETTLSETPATEATQAPVYTTAPSETPATTAPATSQTAQTTQAPVTQQADTTAAQTQNTSLTPDKMDNEELLEFFNKSINGVKTSKPGFTKAKLTSILDLKLSNSAANSLVGIVKGALLSEETETTPVAKGEDCTNVLSPSGQTFASRMNLGDVKSIKCETSGSDYVITVYTVDQTNPEKNTGVMSDVYDYICVDDVMNTYAPKVGATVARQDVELVFTDCYAKLTVSADGKVKAYETYVKGNMNMYNATVKKVVTISTDLFVTLASKTEYTNFSY